MPVPITEEEKRSPVYKYFSEVEMTVPDPELIASVRDPLPADEMLRPEDMNRIFEHGFLPQKIGYALFEDGTAGLYNTLFFPDITPEMFDWWFVFKGIKPLHYKIWDQNNHYTVETSEPVKSRDKTIPIRERIWNNTHWNKESFYPGGPVQDMTLTFRNPADVGFDAEKLYGSGGTIICSGDAEQTAITSHYMRPAIGGGCELHTYFWFGYHIIDRKPVKCIPDGVQIPADAPKSVLAHCILEMGHLRKILPGLYADFHDWLV